MRRLLLLAASVSTACPLHAQTCVTGEVRYGQVVNSVPAILFPLAPIVFFVEECDTIEFAGVSYDATQSDGNGDLSARFGFNLAGALGATAGLIQAGIGSPNFIDCTRTTTTPLLTAYGDINLYSFHAGGGGPFGKEVKINIKYDRDIEVHSPIATTLEVPYHVSGSVVAGESFGDAVTNRAVARLRLTGTVNGQSIGSQEVEVESVTVIPETGSISFSGSVPVAVSPGVTLVPIHLTGEAYGLSVAKSTGLFGSISGAATAGVNFPNTIEIGGFTGVGGTEIPQGVRIIESATGAVLYGDLPVRYCPSELNSTGERARIDWIGSASLVKNQLGLASSDLPPGSFGFFLCSRDRGFSSMPGGSQGNLCLSGEIGRYVGAGVLQAGPFGRTSTAVDLAVLPGPLGPVSVQQGDRWRFQYWYRDSSGGLPTSNFTDALDLLVL